MAKAITRTSCSLFDRKNGQSKVTIDLSYTPSQEVQRIQLKSLFTDDEFQRQCAFYKYYKIDIVNAMFFANNGNGQVFINYAAPNDNLISLDNDFSRVVSYPMYKIKNVLFTHINARINTGDGVFNFNSWNSSQIIPDNIGDLIVYNRNQLVVNLRVRIVVRFRGYAGEAIINRQSIPVLEEDKKYKDMCIQTDDVKILKKQIIEEPKKEEDDIGKINEKLYNELKELKAKVMDKYPLWKGDFQMTYEEIDECPEYNKLNEYATLYNKKMEQLNQKDYPSEEERQNAIRDLYTTLWSMKLQEIQKYFSEMRQLALKNEHKKKPK